ncbi:MAG TPA: murein biosynthesis integral membrane protein MurJ [Candidatus Woesebacteria bacterium]|nr:murein biosynthesis integral membrane protein MurJ [Candidatus Woesebacteria bacterium]
MVQKIFSRSQELLNRKSSSILSAATIIAASFLLSAFLGLIRNRLLAARFFGGLEGNLDAYFAAFIIPDTVFQLFVVGAVSAAFIPIYQSYLKKSVKKANFMANVALTWVTSILLIISILIAIFAKPLSQLISHYTGAQLDLMVDLIRLMSIAQIFFTLSSFLTGILQAQQRFLIPAIAPLFYNLGTILGILILTPYLGIYAAAIGVIFGSLLHMLVQIPPSLSLHYYPKIRFRRHRGVIRMLRLMPPRTLSLALIQVERIVSLNLASALSAGSFTIFNFARQVYVLPISLFGVSLGQASFPTLSEEALSKDQTKFASTLGKTILQLFFFCFLTSVLMLILRIPIVRIVFGAKNFPWEATLLTGKALAVFSLSIAPQAAVQVLTRAFYAKKDTKTPLIINIATIVLFIITSYLFTNSLSLGVLGMSLAMSLCNALNFIILYLVIRSRIPSMGLTKEIFKMFFVSVLTAFALWVPMRLLDTFVFDTTRTVPLLVLTAIVSLIGFGVYYGLSSLLRVKQLDDVKTLFGKLGNWRKVLGETDEVIEAPVAN